MNRSHRCLLTKRKINKEPDWLIQVTWQTFDQSTCFIVLSMSNCSRPCTAKLRISTWWLVPP